VSSRFDVIVDFSQFPVGSKAYLKETPTPPQLPQNVGVVPADPLPPRRSVAAIVAVFLRAA